MALQGRGAGSIDLSGGSRKRKKLNERANFSFWSELPADLLEIIMNKLGVIQFLIIACVCKSWRAVAIAMRQEFMAAQGPLVFFMPTNARKYCYFYNMYETRLYRTALPHLGGNKCVGITCGYLVLADSTLLQKKANIWFVNPFTRHELGFPRPPKPYSNVILASLVKPVPEFVAVAFSRGEHPFLQFCRSRDAGWTVFEYGERVDQRGRIIDVVVFKGKIYLLTSNGELGTLKLNSEQPTVTWLDVERASSASIISKKYSSHLVAYLGELYVSEFSGLGVSYKIRKLNFDTKKWEKVKLQGDFLFQGNVKTVGVTFPRIPTPSAETYYWKDMNWACYAVGGDELHPFGGGFMALYLVADDREKLIVPATPRFGRPNIFESEPLWYFPYLSTSVDSVYEY